MCPAAVKKINTSSAPFKQVWIYFQQLNQIFNLECFQFMELYEWLVYLFKARKFGNVSERLWNLWSQISRPFSSKWPLRAQESLHGRRLHFRARRHGKVIKYILYYTINFEAWVMTNDCWNSHFSSQAQKKGFEGPRLGVKVADENKRNFTAEKLAESNKIIGLQYGSNRGASQAGMPAFGNSRKILPDGKVMTL